MKLFKSLIAGTMLSMLASTSWALGSFDVNSLVGTKYDAFVKDAGAIFSYKAISPAEPLGLLGFDVGVEITATSVEGIDEWGDAIGSTSVSVLPFPKIHAHKGLPMGIDLGLVYSSLPTVDMSYVGGEIRYSFISGNLAIPAVAIRGTYTQLLGLDQLDLNTKGVELTVSKGFLMLTPYLGVGNIWTSSTLDLNGVASVSSDVSQVKYFAGLNINLGLINFVGEFDQTGDSKSYTAKIGLRF